MTKLQKIQMRQSEVREKVRGLLDVETRSEDQGRELTDLTAEATTLETELRAALATDDTERTTVETVDAETRERRAIRGRTGLQDYLRAATVGAPVSGAAAEFSAACGVLAGDHVPLALFDTHRQPVEVRAATPGPAIDAPAMPTVPYLFERSVIGALNVIFPAVASGIQQIPAITTAPPADTLIEGGAAPSTAAAYTLASRAPKRISGQIEFSVEDLAVHPALESDLSIALQGSLSNELDETAINGNNAGGDLNGLFQQATDVSADGTTDTFPLGLAGMAALVDGRYARSMGDIRAIIGPLTFAHYMGLYHGGSGDMTLLEKLRSLMGSVEVSDRMPALSGGAQKGLVTKNAAGQPIRIYTWDSLQMVRDPFTSAATGVVKVTAYQQVSDPFVPHGTNQIVEINRDLS